MYIYIYIYIYIFRERERAGKRADSHWNHFWGNCESLWPTDSSYFWITANHFSNGFAKRSFFLSSPPF